MTGPGDPAEKRRQRWQIVLGDGSDALGGLSGDGARIGRALGFLYDRGLGAGRNVRGAGDSGGPGGLGESALTVPEWINEITELYPRRTVERLEDDAVARYGLTDLVTRREVLERVEPSEALLRAVLATRHLMSEQVLALARALVRRVVAELVERLTTEIRASLLGRRDRLRRSRTRIAANFDAHATIRANLRHVDPNTGRLVIREPLFSSRVRRHSARWQVIVLVDQSGSMAGSVIHAAVTASVFHAIPALRTHLIAFDTSVVDLTAEVSDPVEMLMRVQLGGGTDITQALRYAAQLVDTPRRTMIVLISDLDEGASTPQLLRTAGQLVGSGVRLLVLGALDYSGAARANPRSAQELRERGAEVAVLTPFELAEWVATVLG